ncbi:MAG: flagellar protein G [Halarchaeum sp.]
MASVSVSHMILFIASLIVAASVAGTMTNGVDQLSGAIQDQSLNMADTVRSNVEIISDPAEPVYDRNGQGNVELLVKNTGSDAPPPDASSVDVLLDGRYEANVDVTLVDGAGGRWRSGDVVRLTIPADNLASGDHRVKVVVDGDSEVFRFRT